MTRVVLYGSFFFIVVSIFFLPRSPIIIANKTKEKLAFFVKIYALFCNFSQKMPSHLGTAFFYSVTAWFSLSAFSCSRLSILKKEKVNGIEKRKEQTSDTD